MEWPQELLELFNDPLLDGVRPKEAHDGRLPSRSGADLKEKQYARNLAALRRDAIDMLEPYDRLGILKME